MGSNSAPAVPSGPSSVWSISTSDPWVMQQPYLNYAMRNSSNLWSEAPGQFYPGSTFAPLNPMQQQALQERTRVSSDVMPGYIDAAQGAWQSALNAPNAGANPYLPGYLEMGANRLTSDYQNKVLPGIGDRMEGAGQVGSSRHGIAQGMAAQGLQQSIGDMNAQFLNQAYGQGLQAQGAAQAFSPQMAAMGYMPSDAMAGVGDVLRQENQRYIDDEMARWNFRMQEPYTRLQAFGLPTAQSWGSTGLNTSTSIPSQGGATGSGGGFNATGGVGGALSGAALGGQYGSIFGLPGAAVGGVGGALLGGLL